MLLLFSSVGCSAHRSLQYRPGAMKITLTWETTWHSAHFTGARKERNQSSCRVYPWIVGATWSQRSRTFSNACIQSMLHIRSYRVNARGGGGLMPVVTNVRRIPKLILQILHNNYSLDFVNDYKIAHNLNLKSFICLLLYDLKPILFGNLQNFTKVTRQN